MCTIAIYTHFLEHLYTEAVPVILNITDRMNRLKQFASRRQTINHSLLINTVNIKTSK